jgi:hypothetical protein
MGVPSFPNRLKETQVGVSDAERAWDTEGRGGALHFGGGMDVLLDGSWSVTGVGEAVKREFAVICS